MPVYTAKVQLEDAAQNDFEALDIEMGKKSFVRIKRNQVIKKGYRSASSEYNYRGNLSLHEITEAVYKAAKNTGKRYSFTVMKDKNLRLATD